MSVMREENVENIFQMLMRENLEEALKEDVVHLKKAGIRKNLSQKYMDMELTKEQREVIEQLLYLSGEKKVQYGDCAYKTGFRDCITIMKALHILV